MVLLYMVTFTINIPPMLAYIIYTIHGAYGSVLYKITGKNMCTSAEDQTRPGSPGCPPPSFEPRHEWNEFPATNWAGDVVPQLWGKTNVELIYNYHSYHSYHNHNLNHDISWYSYWLFMTVQSIDRYIQYLLHHHHNHHPHPHPHPSCPCAACLKEHSQLGEVTSFKHAAAASSCAATTCGLGHARWVQNGLLRWDRNPIPKFTKKTPKKNNGLKGDVYIFLIILDLGGVFHRGWTLSTSHRNPQETYEMIMAKRSIIIGRIWTILNHPS